MHAPIRWFKVRGGKELLSDLPHFDASDFYPPLGTRLLILQATPFCNLHCDYCYLPHRDEKSFMSLGTVRSAMRRLRDDGLLRESITVVWHAGEPLVVDPEFYESAIETCREVAGAGCQVSHAIQTNAVLIDDAWCSLFERHKIRIGVSIDGPPSMHDLHRRTRTGHDTHSQVLRGMSKLRERGIEYHVIAVLTADSLSHADEFAKFFIDQGVTELGCNFDEAEGMHRESSVKGLEQDHQLFLMRLLDIANASNLHVREFVNAAYVILNGLPTYTWRDTSSPFNAQVVPFAIVSVASNGDFGTFSPELLGQSSDNLSFKLGNVNRDGFLESAAHFDFLRLWDAVYRGVQLCKSQCPYFNYCGGGSPVNKLYENGDMSSSETLYCRSMIKRPFDLMLQAIEHRMAS